MPVEIKIYHESADQTLAELRTFASALSLNSATVDGLNAAAAIQKVESRLHHLENSTMLCIQDLAAGRAATDESGQTSGFTSTPARERGKPSAGAKRRTKEEIAEDEAADASEAVAQHEADGGATTSIGEVMERQGISSGEERVSPEDEADAAQDAADEAAETESHGGLQPRERLRKALGSLGIKAGVEAVKPGGLIGMTIDQVPEDEIEAMIAKIEKLKRGEIVWENDKGGAKERDEVNAAEEIPGVKSKNAATKDDLMQAMLDYAEVYDGTRDPNQAKLAAEDCGKVFQLAFKNEAIKNLSTVPADGYEKAIAGIKEAIEKNPYKRERKG